MDSKLKDILTQFIEAIKKDIQGSEILKNGSVKNMVVSEVTENYGQILAPYWFNVFWEGRKPGKMPPVRNILYYVVNYNLLEKCPEFLPKVKFSAKKQEQFAWAIAKTMQSIGNTLYRQLHGGTVRYNVKALDIKTIISDDRINSFVNVFADELLVNVSSQLFKVNE